MNDGGVDEVVECPGEHEPNATDMTAWSHTRLIKTAAVIAIGAVSMIGLPRVAWAESHPSAGETEFLKILVVIIGLFNVFVLVVLPWLEARRRRRPPTRGVLSRKGVGSRRGGPLTGGRGHEVTKVGRSNGRA